MTNLGFNRFSYVIGADQATQDELINWVTKSLQYINEFFEGDRSRIARTKFGDCVSKIEYLADVVTYFEENPDYEREMILTREASQYFIRKYKIQKEATQ